MIFDGASWSIMIIYDASARGGIPIPPRGADKREGGQKYDISRIYL